MYATEAPDEAPEAGHRDMAQAMHPAQREPSGLREVCRDRSASNT
jgi:hypothetical protein